MTIQRNPGYGENIEKPVFTHSLKPPIENAGRDNRKSKRRYCRVPVTCKFYNPENLIEDDFISKDARTTNYSRAGLCFETTIPLHTDLPVLIRLNEPETRSAGFGSEEAYHAEVKWCQPIFARTAAMTYRIGVEFYEPIL